MSERLKTRAVAAGAVGNALEWYDFAVYGFLAPFLARSFFPSDDRTTALIATFGVFAAGFLMRPIGGLLLGHIGDRMGARAALLISVLMMAVSTLLIALLPGYAAIGIAAPILLTVLRMLQGLSVGGEYTGSIAYLVEQAPPQHRGFVASLASASSVAGMLAGSGVAALVAALLDHDQLVDWGWRIPFALGLVLCLAVTLLRRTSLEAEAPIRPPERSPLPLVLAVRAHWRAMLRVAVLNLLTAVGFYMMFVYITTYLRDVVHEHAAQALEINTGTMAVLLLLVPLAGWLSDRVGRKPLLVAGALGFAVGALPLLWLMHHQDAWLVVLGQSGFAVLLALFAGPIPATMSEQFPPAVRCTAVSIAYNLPLALFGGTTPVVATWLIERSHDDLSPAWYLIAIALASLAAAITLPGRKAAPAWAAAEARARS